MIRNEYLSRPEKNKCYNNSSMRESPESPGTFAERVQFYQDQAEQLLNRHGREFVSFVTGKENLANIGDTYLRTYEATGYNILNRRMDMPLASNQPLIFYGNYIGRTHHFGLLLATMEQERIITPDQVRFGVRGAKVLHDPEWGREAPELAQAGIIQRINPQGEISEDPILQSIEAVIIFSLSINDPEQVLGIARFLRQKAKQNEPGAIEGSNVDPDIRATVVLRDVLPESEFPSAIANIRSIGQAQVVVLRKETKFIHPWKAMQIEANEELVGYVVGEGVLP